MSKSDFTEDSVAHGLKLDEFSELPERQKRRLLKLIAQISEASYRRGVQQARTLKIEFTSNELYEMRYKVPLSQSPDILHRPPQSQTALARLRGEYGVLKDLGFPMGLPEDFD